MKVKMFTNQDISKLEEEVNKWLKDNPGSISHIKQSVTYDSTDNALYTLISIWYIDKL